MHAQNLDETMEIMEELSKFSVYFIAAQLKRNPGFTEADRVGRDLNGNLGHPHCQRGMIYSQRTLS